jgi:hypothetical protein
MPDRAVVNERTAFGRTPVRSRSAINSSAGGIDAGSVYRNAAGGSRSREPTLRAVFL